MRGCPVPRVSPSDAPRFACSSRAAGGRNSRAPAALLLRFAELPAVLRFFRMPGPLIHPLTTESFLAFACHPLDPYARKIRCRTEPLCRLSGDLADCDSFLLPERIRQPRQSISGE